MPMPTPKPIGLPLELEPLPLLPPLVLLRDKPKPQDSTKANLAFIRGSDQAQPKAVSWQSWAALKIETTLESFGAPATVKEILAGPTVTQFALEPLEKVRVAQIVKCSADLALALRVRDVRIEPSLEGKGLIGLEVPNPERQMVTLAELYTERAESGPYGRSSNSSSSPARPGAGAGSVGLSLAIGRDLSGKPIVASLTKMPHLLIAGTTGSGKSVCLNALIVSLLIAYSPEQLQIIMVDPKLVELTSYAELPHLRFPVVTNITDEGEGEGEAEEEDEETIRRVGVGGNSIGGGMAGVRLRTGGAAVPGPGPEEERGPSVLAVLHWAIGEMQSRLVKLSRAKCRNIEGYNQQQQQQQQSAISPMPYLVIVIDELADLMMTAPKPVEDMLVRLAQKGRAAGIHLILATQRPTVKVVTGLIKANCPARIGFAVASQVDSRVVLDKNGAEKLLGQGDMLFHHPNGGIQYSRVQGAFVSDAAIERVVEWWKAKEKAKIQSKTSSAPLKPIVLPLFKLEQQAGDEVERDRAQKDKNKQKLRLKQLRKKHQTELEALSELLKAKEAEISRLLGLVGSETNSSSKKMPHQSQSNKPVYTNRFSSKEVKVAEGFQVERSSSEPEPESVNEQPESKVLPESGRKGNEVKTGNRIRQYQKAQVEQLAQEKGYTMAQVQASVQKLFGMSLEELNESQAGAVIEKLKGSPTRENSSRNPTKSV